MRMTPPLMLSLLLILSMPIDYRKLLIIKRASLFILNVYIYIYISIAYLKKVKADLEKRDPDRVKDFQKGATDLVKFILASFDDFQL